MPLKSVLAQNPFEKWVIDFIGPNDSSKKHSKSRFIIIGVEYLTKWEKVEPTRYYIARTTAKFLYENIIIRYGFPLSIVSNQGKHFVNNMIKRITTKFYGNPQQKISIPSTSEWGQRSLKQNNWKIINKDV